MVVLCLLFRQKRDHEILKQNQENTSKELSLEQQRLDLEQQRIEYEKLKQETENMKQKQEFEKHMTELELTVGIYVI